MRRGGAGRAGGDRGGVLRAAYSGLQAALRSLNDAVFPSETFGPWRRRCAFWVASRRSSEVIAAGIVQIPAELPRVKASAAAAMAKRMVSARNMAEFG